MTRKGSVLPTKDLGKRFKHIDVMNDDVGTTSRRLLFSSPQISSTGMSLIYSPQCSSALPVRSRRLRGHSNFVDANTSSVVIRSVDLPPAPHKRLKKRKSHDVVASVGATVRLLQSTAHLQELDSGLAPSSPSDNVNVRLSKLSSIASRGCKRLKGSASDSRYALREDVDLFKRLTIIPTEAWQLPHKDPCHHCRAIRFTYEPSGFCCASGKVKIQLPKMPDELWNLYVNDLTPMGVEFRRRCRTYNNSMAFTSIKMTYDEALAKANKGVYTFKVQGIVRHYIQELTPKDSVPRHLQLYFYGTERELENRLSQSGGLDSAIMALLVDILKNNPYHNFFTNLQNTHDLDTYAIVLRANPKLDPRVYNFPVVDHVAAIWNEGMGPSFEQPRDIRVNLRSGGVRYVHYYYGCYDPLQYCLIFPYGEPGWYAGIPKKSQNINLTFHRANEDNDNFENDDVDPLLHQEVDTLLAAEQNST